MPEDHDLRIRRHRSNLAVALHKFLLAAEAYATSHRDLTDPQVKLAFSVLRYFLPAARALDQLLRPNERD